MVRECLKSVKLVQVSGRVGEPFDRGVITVHARELIVNEGKPLVDIQKSGQESGLLMSLVIRIIRIHTF